MIGSTVLQLAIADLGIVLDAREAGIALALPQSYSSFELCSSVVQRLNLDVRNARSPQRLSAGSPCSRHEETWQLWRDEAGCDVFVAP